MMPGGDESRHIEGGPDTWASAGNSCAWWCIAGLADVRSKAGQAGNGLAVTLADFGQMMNELKPYIRLWNEARAGE